MDNLHSSTCTAGILPPSPFSPFLTMDRVTHAVNLTTQLDVIDALRAFFIFAACTVCVDNAALSLSPTKSIPDANHQLPCLLSLSLHHLWRPRCLSVRPKVPARPVQLNRCTRARFPSFATGPSQLLHPVLHCQPPLVCLLGSSAPLPWTRVPGNRIEDPPRTSRGFHVCKPGDGLLGVDDDPGFTASVRVLGLF